MLCKEGRLKETKYVHWRKSLVPHIVIYRIDGLSKD